MINPAQVQQLITARGQGTFEVYDEVLREVSGRIEANGSASKADIGSLVFWKRIQANTKWAAALHDRPDEEVRGVTGRAFQVLRSASESIPDVAQRARVELRALPGFQSGYSLASALLVAAAPDRMAVYDRRARAGLQRLGVPFDGNSGYGSYMAVIEALRSDVNAETDSGWTARQVDLALFNLGR